MSRESFVIDYPVTDIAKPDLMAAVRCSLDKVVRYGGTFHNWKADILPALQHHGWWGVVSDRDLTGSDEAIVVDDRYLQVVYDINVRIAVASIRWHRVQRQKDVLPYLRMLSYRAWEEDGQCFCGSIDSVILPADHSYWLEAFPPNSADCKCILEQVSERRMKKKGWAVTAEADLPSSLAIPEPYRCNFGVRFPTDWQPELITF